MVRQQYLGTPERTIRSRPTRWRRKQTHKPSRGKSTPVFSWNSVFTTTNGFRSPSRGSTIRSLPGLRILLQIVHRNPHRDARPEVIPSHGQAVRARSQREADECARPAQLPPVWSPPAHPNQRPLLSPRSSLSWSAIQTSDAQNPARISKRRFKLTPSPTGTGSPSVRSGRVEALGQQCLFLQPQQDRPESSPEQGRVRLSLPCAGCAGACGD